MAVDAKTRARWTHHLGEEIDAAFLYRRLAQLEPSDKRRALYLRIAEVEDRHAALWQNLFRENGHPVPSPSPSLKARLMAQLARRFGAGFLLGALLREEGREVKGYLKLHQSGDGAAKQAALTLARESAMHAETLRGLSGASGEPWHQAESGGLLRNVVYGFNDGLTANFGLVAGVLGADVSLHVLLLSGLSGAIADALSMGSSGYLAAKSESEVYQHEIEMEREEMLLMPEVEEEELALIYEAKGIDEMRARELARQVMASPGALEEKARMELGIDPDFTLPLREGLITGAATLIGAAIPVLPFMMLSGPWAIWTSFVVSMGTHFGVGAMRSVFTGRGIIRSGMDMFLVGLGVAAAGYLVGDAFTRWWMG